jgi:hypothetical protein
MKIIDTIDMTAAVSECIRLSDKSVDEGATAGSYGNNVAGNDNNSGDMGAPL